MPPLTRTRRNLDPANAASWLMVGLIAVGAAVLQPVSFTIVLIAATACVVVAARPEWGVGILLTALLVTYGQMPGISGEAALGTILPAGAGLLTINNMLGVFLAVLMVYHIYKEHDWSFLRNRQVQLVIALTIVLVVSNVLNATAPDVQTELGLHVRGQDPRRIIVSRALFLVLFVFFVRDPRALRVVIGIFLALAISSALAGLTAALGGYGFRPHQAGYRAGGPWALIGTAGNPNRLAMISTLALAIVWEYHQAGRRRWKALLLGVVVILILTVFMTASRGGLVGLLFAGLLLAGRWSRKARSVLYFAAVALLVQGLVARLVPEQTLERLSNIPGITSDPGTTGGGSVERRQYTIGVALEMAKEAPILGVGIGNWGPTRFTSDPLRSTAPPHNSYLLVLVEGGVLTLGLYLFLFYLSLRQLAELESDPEVALRAGEAGLGWLLGALRVCLPTFLVCSLFADLWESVIFYLLIGSVAVLVRLYGGPGRQYAVA